MQKWYAVMSNSRQEQAATTIGEQAGIETYYPEINESFTVKGRRHRHRSGLFTGYFFAKFDYNKKIHRMVSYCRGVRRGLKRYSSLPCFGRTGSSCCWGLFPIIRAWHVLQLSDIEQFAEAV